MMAEPARGRVAVLAALALLASWAAAGCGRADEGARPNIVFVMADDLGWSDLGCYGSDYYETPNVDRLRAQGLKFTQAYANGPICAPTRSALLSGRHYPNNPVYAVSESTRGKERFRELVPPPNEPDLPARYVTFAEVLRDAGYATAHLGKWHHGDDRRGTGPSDQGFERNVGGYDTGFPSWRGATSRPTTTPSSTTRGRAST